MENFPAFISPVNGITFFEVPKDDISQGSLIIAERDLNNKYDPFAFKIIFNNLQIGYLPKDLAKKIALKGFNNLRGKVEQVLQSDLGYGLRVKFTEFEKNALFDSSHDTSSTKEGMVGSISLNQGNEVNPFLVVKAKEVKSKSGRTLGTFLYLKDGKVAIENVDGQVINFPQELVIY